MSYIFIVLLIKSTLISSFVAMKAPVSGDILYLYVLEYKEKGSVSAFTRKLNKIESSSMRAACKHMLSIDASSRLSAEACISLL